MELVTHWGWLINIRNNKIKSPTRLFFAVELAPQIKTELLTLQDSFSELTATPVSPDNFHITLCFLGNATERQVEAILDNFVSLSIAPFEVKLSHFIYWPKPEIIALSIQDQTNKLNQCKKQIEKQLSQLNFFSYDKKEFIPHITLLRNVEPPLKDNKILEQPFPTKPIKVEQISLIQSQTNQHGVHYQILEEWQLRSPSIKQQLLGH